MASSTVMTGTMGLGKFMRHVQIFLIFLASLASCSTTEEQHGGVSLQSLLHEIGSSTDGALSRIRRLVPEDGMQVLAPNVHRPAPFATSDGYEVKRMLVNLSSQGEVTSYAFYLAEDRCMSLDALPGFSRAELSRARTYPPGALVRGSYREWVLDLPEAWVSIVPQAQN